jgi:hypothetical protein
MSERLKSKRKEKPLFGALERDYLAAIVEGTVNGEELAELLYLSLSSIRNRQTKIGNILRERVIEPNYGFQYKGELSKLRIIKLLNYFNITDHINPDMTKPFPLIVDPNNLPTNYRESVYLYSEGMNLDEIAYILSTPENEITRKAVDSYIRNGITKSLYNEAASDTTLGGTLDSDSYALYALAYMRSARTPTLLVQEIQPKPSSLFSRFMPASAPVLKEAPVPPLFLMPLDDAKALYHYALRPQILI